MDEVTAKFLVGTAGIFFIIIDVKSQVFCILDKVFEGKQAANK
jgi:hypothetical protein